jgi:hypothetical protein
MITQFYTLDISGGTLYVQVDHTKATTTEDMTGEAWFQREGFECRLRFDAVDARIRIRHLLFGIERFQTFWENQHEFVFLLKACFECMNLLYPEAKGVEACRLYVDTGKPEAASYYTLDNLGEAMFGTSWWSHHFAAKQHHSEEEPYGYLYEKPDIMTFTYGPYGRDAVRLLQQLEPGYKTLPHSLAFFQSLQHGDMLANIHPWLVYYIQNHNNVGKELIPCDLGKRLLAEEDMEYTEPFEHQEAPSGLCVRSRVVTVRKH